MEITFINVGYGDAILIVDEGYKILIDGGSANPDEYNGYENRIRAFDYLKKAGINELDLIIVTHVHEDHVCGLYDIIENMTVKKIYTPYPKTLFLSGKHLEIGEDSPRSAKMFTGALNTMRKIILRAEENNIKTEELSFEGEEKVISLTNNINLAVLAPDKGVKDDFINIIKEAYTDLNLENVTEKLVLLDRTSNDAGLLLKLTYKKHKILLAADSCPRCWKHISGNTTLEADVLKLPHHGQADSITDETILQISPSYVVTTSSSDRRYNSSNNEVYRKITELVSNKEVTFLFTDEHSYEPYFSHKDSYNGLKLTLNDDKISKDFILYKNE